MFFCTLRLVSVMTLLLLSLLTCSCVFAQERQLDAAAAAASKAGTLGPDNTTYNNSITDQPPLREPIKVDGSQLDSIDDKSLATTNAAARSTVEKSVDSKTEAKNGERSDGRLADAQTAAADAQIPTGTTTSTTGTTTSTTGTTTSTTATTTSTTATTIGNSDNKSKRTFGNVLKSNIVETFQLDPRLQKDLTEGSLDLRPVRLMQDYFAVGYNPTIEWDRTGHSPWLPTYGKTNMALYAVGPITKHLSMWIQGLPLVNDHGFFQHFELFQGLANYGNDKSFFQLQGGQGFAWENSGWGGADRTITQTFPGVYTPFNGFDPTNTSKMISASATGMNWTTGKVFGYWQPGATTSQDPNITYTRGYGVGLTFEKLIGKTGISGIQSNLTLGNTPAYNGNTSALTGNIIGTQPGPFVSWTSWINKSFQDRKGFVRLNPSFGLTAFHQHRNLDDPTLPVPGQPTTGYGYTFDLVAIPVTSYLTNVLRFDQYRTNSTDHDDTTFTFSAGQAIDFHLPNKAKLRVTLDYQLVGQHGLVPSHRMILGFWPIW